MSTKLQEARKQRGWSRTRLCHLLTRRAAADEIALPSIASLSRMVSRWENGHVIPGELYRPLLAKVYGRTESELGFDVASASDTHITTDVPLCYATHLSSDVNEALAITGPARVSRVTLDALESSIIDMWQRDDQYGGEALRPAVTAQLRHVLHLLSGCREASKRRRLNGIAAELARLAGWMHFDARHFSVGWSYFEEALRLAQQNDDKPFMANVLANMSLQATYQDRPQDAVALVRGAQDACRSTATPRVQSMLAMREAFAHASLGDGSACHTAISDAQRHLARADGHEADPGWVTYFGETKLITDVGIALSQLGEAGTAEPLIRNGIDSTDSWNIRSRAFHTYWLARTQLQSSQLDEACSTVEEAVNLVSSVDSARVLRHVNELNKRLAAHKNVKIANTTRQLIAEVLPG